MRHRGDNGRKSDKDRVLGQRRGHRCGSREPAGLTESRRGDAITGQAFRTKEARRRGKVEVNIPANHSSLTLGKQSALDLLCHMREVNQARGSQASLWLEPMRNL